MERTNVSHLRSEIKQLWYEHGSFTIIAQELKEKHPDLPMKVDWLRRLVSIELDNIWQLERERQLGSNTGSVNTEELDELDIISQNTALAAKVQKTADINRIERLSWRSHTRAYTAIETLQEQMLATLNECQVPLSQQPVYTKEYTPKGPVAVVHLSDLHFNELVNVPTNKYDFQVAAKRLQLLAAKVKRYASDCQRVVVAIGGDVINSDRRIDELLSMATNRARAVVLAAHILRQFVQDLRTSFYVEVFGITGNEGRAKKELSWAEPAVSDSYDASVYWTLSALLGDQDPGLVVHPLQGNEVLFKIHNQLFLLLHGHQVNAADQHKVQAILGKHSATSNTQVTHVLCGHVHSTLISDFISRNASLVGSNAYSSEGLSFASKAAQNLHIVTLQGLDGIKLDLQNVDGIPGYHVLPELEVHGAKALAAATLGESQTPQVYHIA